MNYQIKAEENIQSLAQNNKRIRKYNEKIKDIEKLKNLIVPSGKEGENKAEVLSKGILAENFPEFERHQIVLIQEPQWFINENKYNIKTNK